MTKMFGGRSILRQVAGEHTLDTCLNLAVALHSDRQSPQAPELRGRILTQSGDPRIMQFGVKYDF